VGDVLDPGGLGARSGDVDAHGAEASRVRWGEQGRPGEQGRLGEWGSVGAPGLR
jgi:hypothetical protein